MFHGAPISDTFRRKKNNGVNGLLVIKLFLYFPQSFSVKVMLKLFINVHYFQYFSVEKRKMTKLFQH